MFRIVFGILITLICIVGCIVTKTKYPLAGLVVAALIVATSFFATVPANNVGIQYSIFNGTSDQTLGEGIHLKNPLNRIYKISTEVQTVSVQGMTSQTKDSQFVASDMDIKYRVNRDNAYMIFQQYRNLDNVTNSLVMPTTQRVLELITTKYNVMDILGSSRADIYMELERDLSTEFAKYGIEFYSISILDMDAGEALENAITQEAVAKKSVETAEQELLRSQTQAKQKSVEAQAEQDAAKIKAETLIIEAQAEAEANRVKTQSLTDMIIKDKWIEKWNGTVPQFYGGNDTGLIMNMGE